MLITPVAAEDRMGLLGGVNLATLHETPEGGHLSTLALPEFGVDADLELGRRISLRFEPAEERLRPQ